MVTFGRACLRVRGDYQSNVSGAAGGGEHQLGAVLLSAIEDQVDRRAVAIAGPDRFRLRPCPALPATRRWRPGSSTALSPRPGARGTEHHPVAKLGTRSRYPGRESQSGLTATSSSSITTCCGRGRRVAVRPPARAMAREMVERVTENSSSSSPMVCAPARRTRRGVPPAAGCSWPACRATVPWRGRRPCPHEFEPEQDRLRTQRSSTGS